MDRKTPLPPIDPGHESKRAVLARIGLVLLVIGVSLGLVGAYRFFSVFFGDGMDLGPGRPASGMIMLMIGGVLGMVGLQMTVAANFGKILRYQVGESMPVAHEAARHGAPIVTEMAHAAAQGFFDAEQTLVGPVLRHSCGAANDPDDRFCKGCGSPLAARLCPSCQARNEADANFCAHCGAALTVV